MMLSELSRDLRTILLAGIGAAAVTAEKSEEILRDLVKKGELTVAEGRALGEELKHRAKAGRREEQPLPDVDRLTPEERAALKAQLEAAEARAASDHSDAPASAVPETESGSRRDAD